MSDVKYIVTRCHFSYIGKTINVDNGAVIIFVIYLLLRRQICPSRVGTLMKKSVVEK